MRILIASAITPARPLYNDAGTMVLLEFGLLTAMTSLPAIVVLTCGVGFPVFRLWIRLGFKSVAAYIGGGIITASIGGVIIGVAHTLVDFLAKGNLLFAMLLLGICGPISGFVVWCVMRRATAANLGSQQYW